MPSSRALVLAAAGAYGANVALGTAVAARVIDTSGFRWLHHALYVVTLAATGTAIAGAAARGSVRGALLAPALLPLGLLPFLGHDLHARTGVAAAPWYAAALLARAA